MEPDQWQLGRTKVFVKNPESVSICDGTEACVLIIAHKNYSGGYCAPPPPTCGEYPEYNIIIYDSYFVVIFVGRITRTEVRWLCSEDPEGLETLQVCSVLL